MPKVTRAPASRGRGSTPVTRPGAAAKRAPRRRAPAKPAFFTRLRNQLSARLRAAHYRAGAAARLVSFACLALAALALLIVSGTGRMDSALSAAAAMADDALRHAGFRLQVVDVAGVEAASFDEVRAALGLEYGQSIFALDLEAARQRALALEWVGEAHVFRLLPGRVQVVVTEQIPLARWQIDGRFMLIDAAGAPIDAIGPGEYAGLPLVVGEGAAASAPALLAALAQFPAVGVHVEAAQRVGERRWTLFLRSGAALHLPEQDGEAALAIVNDLEKERGVLSAPAESIDLRNPGQIVVQPLPGAAPSGASSRAGGREA